VAGDRHRNGSNNGDLQQEPWRWRLVGLVAMTAVAVAGWHWDWPAAITLTVIAGVQLAFRRVDVLFGDAFAGPRRAEWLLAVVAAGAGAGLGFRHTQERWWGLLLIGICLGTGWSIKSLSALRAVYR
jgi:hypothetical protein